MTDVISAEEVALRRAFRNYPHFTIEREESFSITYRDKGSDIHIVFFNDTATSEIYSLSLHDALPI